MPIESITFRTNPWMPLNIEKNNTILMAHSFGGYKALNDYLYNSTNIEKIVLISSHTNYAGKAPYPSINENSVKIPFLIHCGTKDRRLPFPVLLADFWKRYDNPNSYLKSRYIFQKNWTHFQAFEKDSIEESTKDIVDFIINQDNSESVIKTKFEFGYQPLIQLPYIHNIDFDICFIDSLIKIITNPIHHKWLHHVYFLSSTPSDFYTLSNTDFTNSYLIKTINITQDQIQEAYQKMFLNKSVISNTIFCPVKISPTVSGLYMWLLGRPSIRKKGDVFEIEYYHIMFPNGKNYYKIPSAKRYLTKFFSLNK